MGKQLLTIGFEIPGFSESEVSFTDDLSIMDADVIVILPESIEPSGDWVSFTAGGGCFDVESSKRFQKKVSHLKKEVLDHLQSGNGFCFFVCQKRIYNRPRFHIRKKGSANV